MVLLVVALALLGGGRAASVAAQSEPEVVSIMDAEPNLTGDVVIGPTCPVVRLDRLDQCQDRPYAATLSIQTADGTSQVTRVTTDDQGHFAVALEAGTYQVVPLTPPGSILPRGVPQTVTLVDGVTSSIVVQYDSGIR